MALLTWLRGLLGLQDKPAGPPPEPPPPPPPAAAAPLDPGPEAPAAPPPPQDDSAAFQAGFDRRYAYWAAVGQVEDDVLTHLISPSFTGGPAWPSTRQAYRVVRRGHSLVLATDGLSDPFDNVQGGGNGYGMELFVETADIAAEFAGLPGDVAGLSRSWAFELLSHVAGTVAGAGGIVHQLERHGVLSMELPGFSQAHSLPDQLPPGFVTEDDALGLLLGGPDPDFPRLIEDMPLSPVRMVPVVLLKAAELTALRQGGAEARRVLAERLAATTGHRSSLTRPPMTAS
ncbi:suppressor of fused domain protein [Teichococcus deserti]|uniref:suppressor of fused domain protein n=1 Tax=Teichococcus deserti TaxID=1817963 RepID=UPI001F61F409|nr:suppressor of fused domain protein [Pseudoroseomonas deserti]